MNEAVRREVVKTALMQQVAIECSKRGFTKEDRMALASLIFNKPGIESTRELSESQLRHFLATLRATDWVIEIHRQNYKRNNP